MRLLRPTPTILLLLCALAAGACDKKTSLPEVLNQRPEVSLSQAPASSSQPYFYAYEIFWAGHDPDGRVDHYLYAVDPPTRADSETTWVVTTENRRKFLFASGDPDSLGTVTNPGGFHVFVIKAIDDRGAASPVVSRAFFTYTVAPTVKFLQPRVDPILYPVVPPTTSITWTGDDPDGQYTRKPIYYKYLLLQEHDARFQILDALLSPDSLRHRYAPEFVGWDSVAGDTARIQLTNLTPNAAYLLVVVAFDEAGAYSPMFGLSSNMLYFYAQYTSINGPKFTVFNDFFNYTYATGSFNTDPSAYIRIEVPSRQSVPFYWYAIANPGSQIRRYRWALDIEDLTDETERTNEATDIRHWSQWGSLNTAATVGPFNTAGSHLFTIEAEDDNGLLSLSIVSLTVVEPVFDKPLLFVEDTRFPVDQKISGRDSVKVPIGAWPSSAELDTFFFARGGVRWRYYPFNAQSEPGVFKGYAFDTVTTRNIRDGFVSLTTLARYRTVVWYVDPAFENTNGPSDPSKPQPGLRYMSGRGRTNTLAVYSGMGGGVWMMGGGFAYNSLFAFNSTTNDNGGVYAWSAASGELVPGRMIHDRAAWRSEILLFKAVGAVRELGAAPLRPGAPNYDVLPLTLDPKDPSTDPLPYVRSFNTFYLTLYDGEFLTKPNAIVEDLDPTVEVQRYESVLDTLYVAQGSSLADNMPIMTWYHGVKSGPFVMSGFPLWYFQRPQVIQVADFVLQQIFGLPREPVSR